ncbi:unnamed protein product [Candida verbasci]|uniref:Uncharacterized protein n=1 Tax=Candida verbasci TaxID=1227364 RepID=A0A9W4TVB8_9ASCO|nr:unnamed protein product [Candida verbasci]
MLRFQVRLYETNSTEEVIDILPDSSGETYEKFIQVALIKYPSSSTLIEEVTNYVKSSSLFEESIYSYKYKLDKLIEEGKYNEALSVYEQSVQSHVPWSSNNKDPMIYKTLNDLIQLIAKNFPIKESFILFQKIKTQLQSEINIDSLNVLTPEILNHNLVADIIEMLKRELPKIPSNKANKLPIDKPYGYKYKQLFDTLYTYAIESTHDSSILAKWSLFDTLYSYFVIPQSYILPAMKFFCDNKRWNAALIIFQKQIELHELHGDHNFNPPNEAMYKYLIDEFGNNLYEYGVIEIHDYLKTDLNLLSQDSELQHSLMKSYCNLQNVSKVRDLFLILNSQGRITNESAAIMLKAYTYNDLIYVEKFWNNLSMFGIIPDETLVKQYLIAYSYHGDVKKCTQLIENIEEDYEVKLDEMMVLDIYNFCYKTDAQQKFKTYFEANYPDLWNKCIESGKLVTNEGYLPDGDALGDKETKLIE